MACGTSSFSESGFLNTRSSRPRSLSDPTTSESDSAGCVADDRELRDRVALHERDRLADLVVRLDRDQLGHLAGVLGEQHLVDGRRGRLALEEPVLDHVVVVQELGEVGAAAVGHDGEHGLPGLHPRGHLEGGVDRRPRRASHQEPLLARHPPRGRERVAVGDGHVLVDQVGVVGLGPEVLADPLDQIGVHRRRGVDRALRVGADHAQVGLLLLEVARAARDGAARPDRDHERVELAAGLLPDLGPVVS